VAKFFWDGNKYGDAEATKITRLYHTAIRDLVRRKLAAMGGDWNSFVYDKSYDLITEADMRQIEADVLATGYRFDVSAVISAKEEPQKYKPLSGQDQIEATAEIKDGRQLVGHGDNVVTYPQNVTGTALYIHTTEEVMDLLMNGVPPDTIAVIDDSGGTLTAPILEHFKAIVCMGGSVRSHLGILSREHGIPCLMNAKVAGIRNGDRLELNVTAPAKTAQDYQQGIEKTAEVWKLVN
jgi:phosphohistidine swiveling domain-containing protein